MIFDAFWPAHLAQHGVQERTLEGGRLLRFPVHTPESVVQLCNALAPRAVDLSSHSAADICSALGAAAARLRKGALHELALEWIPETTGYSPEMTRHVLERMSRDWTEGALARLLVAEFGDPATLDTFTPQPYTTRPGLALGPPVTGHIFSGNVPGVAVTSLVRALLVKSPCIGKTASAEPVLPVLFARALAEVDETLASALVITHWPRGTSELDRALVQHCATVVVYGGADTIDSVRRHALPHTRLVVHGPKISLGIVGPEALGQRSATAVARAVAVFDQQGCVSPHVIYVAAPETRVREFARDLAEALRVLAQELPRGRLSTAEAVAIQQARTSAEFRAIAGAAVVLHAGDALSYTVIYEQEPAFRASCLNRVVYVKPLTQIELLGALLEPVRELLQSAALAGFAAAEHDELARRLADAGVSRVTGFAELPWPPPEWRHDGGPGPLRELVKWVEIE
jgi:hypothetical protein